MGLKTESLGTEEMAESVKCLLRKLGGQGLTL